ncbi:hypothetical protein GDO78_017566 [Eleutherodactylus coqui]|uniref:Uncharacterized protein n=1 Tax=Eleutherodactylus coqui TaxID=57060 RepID=A0A8J6EK53_ELECQ|nr:hypothetical protein GDO78_017566 [Eleutherodactylus coqui]
MMCPYVFLHHCPSGFSCSVGDFMGAVLRREVHGDLQHHCYDNKQGSPYIPYIHNTFPPWFLITDHRQVESSRIWAFGRFGLNPPQK